MALWVLIWKSERLEDALKARDKEASVCSKKVMASTLQEKGKHWMNTGERVVQQKKECNRRGMKQTKECDFLRKNMKKGCHATQREQVTIVIIAIRRGQWWSQWKIIGFDTVKEGIANQVSPEVSGVGQYFGLQLVLVVKASSKSKQRVHHHQSTGSSRMVVCLCSEPIRTRPVWPFGQQAS